MPYCSATCSLLVTLTVVVHYMYAVMHDFRKFQGYMCVIYAISRLEVEDL